jgi:nitrite reductase/ring-hydroxylating ferredoxin subunit
VTGSGDRAAGEGTAPLLCRLADLDATGAKGVTLGVWPQSRDIVVVRDGAAVRAYVNRCPHRSTTLETVPDRFLDLERKHLICSTHGARFRIADGRCVSGPCLDLMLEGAAVAVRDGAVYLAG